MPNIRYFLLDATHAKFGDVIAVARSRHETVHEGAKLSVTFNVARTKALVKVDGADRDWRKARRLNKVEGIVLAIYDRISHVRFMEQFYTPEWQEPVSNVAGEPG